MGIFISFLLVIPWITSSHILFALNLCGIGIIGALGLNILTGYTGQLSIAHGAFVGIGAYTAGILALRLGIPFWLAIPAGGILAAINGLLLGFPSLRLRGLYLIMSTMAFQIIMNHVFGNWKSMTNGHQGLTIPHLHVLGFEFKSDASFYYLILFVVILGTVFAANLMRSRIGRAFMAIRDRDLAVRVMGIDMTKYKLISFALSSFYAGISGGIYAFYLCQINPEHFTITVSIQYIAMIIIGGLGSITGTIYGVLFVTLVPDLIMRPILEALGGALGISGDIYYQVKNAFFGLIIVICLIVEPKGLHGLWERTKAFFKTWPYTY
jgi:branched-chain amino acid transport system permease protein